MNRYLLIRRLRGPAVLLLIGTLALLDQMGVIEHFWHLFWPLLFILMGVILLAERAILSIDGPGVPPYPGSPYSGPPYSGTPYPGSPYPGTPYPGTPYPGAPYTGTPAAQSPATPATAIVPAHDHDFDDHNGGQQ